MNLKVGNCYQIKSREWIEKNCVNKNTSYPNQIRYYFHRNVCLCRYITLNEINILQNKKIKLIGSKELDLLNFRDTETGNEYLLPKEVIGSFVLDTLRKIQDKIDED